jgi:hypothetical protein
MRHARSTQSTERPRVIAVDWSGAAHGAERRIWLAEASPGGQALVRLESGRDRAALVRHVIEESARTPRLVIGLDFAFALPAWYCYQLGLQSAADVWARVARDGEAWLTACAPPFWGRPGRARPVLGGSPLRWTERVVPRTAGVGPRSVFQVGGAGAVGTGSLRGMPLLHVLVQAGATVWPCQAGGWPLVVEIYPRLLSGPVVKSRASARAAHLAGAYPALGGAERRLAIASEDAFDAAVSALVMAAWVDDLARLPPEPDPRLRLEGRIWHPAWRQDPG